MTDLEQAKMWVEQWRQAGPELEAIWRREVAELDTHEVIQQIYGGGGIPTNLPPRMTSGLVVQQAWFARLRRQNQCK